MPEDAFELTNIKVREVSLVDAAANQRKFLVMKKRTGDAITADDAAKALAKAQESQAGTPAAELDAKDAEEAKKEAAVEVLAVEETTVEVPAEVVAVAEILASEAVKSETVTVMADGGVEVDVTVSSFSASSAELALDSKIRTAWQGAIAAVRARLDVMGEQVNNSDFFPWAHIEYIKCMLDSMFDIGGPEWEIEVAATNAAKARGEDVTKRQQTLTKIGRAISGARMRSLKDMHGRVSELQKMFNDLMAEVDVEDTATEKVAKIEDAPVADPIADAVAAVVMATNVTTPHVVLNPAMPLVVEDPALTAIKVQLDKQAAEIARLNTTVDTQEKVLAKARGDVRSNALTQVPESNHNNVVVWDRDMASPSARIRSRVSR